MHSRLRRHLEQHLRRSDIPPECRALVQAVARSSRACTRELLQRIRRLRERNAELNAIREAAPDCIISLDDEGFITDFNPSAERTFGYRREMVIGKSVIETLVPARLRAAYARGLKRYLASGVGTTMSRRVEVSAMRADVTEFPAQMLLSIIRAGKRLRCTMYLSDTSEQRLSEHLDRDRAQVLEMVAKNRPLNETLERLALLLERQRPGMRASILMLREGRLWTGAAPGLPADFNRCVDGLAIGPDVGACGSAAFLGKVVVCADIATDPRWASGRDLALRHGLRACWSMPVAGADGSVLGTFAVYFSEPKQPQPQDMKLLASLAGLAGLAIEHQKLTERLAHAARHDPLTGLPNRVLLEDRLDQCLQISLRSDELIGVFFIDLDGFKYINDTLGHHCGDQLLRQVAARLEHIIRDADTLARMGGDEFTLVAPQLHGREDATRVARRILEAVRAPFHIDGRELTVGASIGVALSPCDGLDCATLQRNADTAMYRAKSLGRNRFEFFNQHMNIAAVERLELETQLRRAISNAELLLHYQPLVCGDGSIRGLEALVRWSHPVLGLISPARFIPLAEETGLIVSIGAWVLREALRQSAEFRESTGRDLFMSINVSALQFAQPDFLTTLLAALREHRADPRRLQLEVTESVLMGNPADAAAKISSVRQIGVSVAIDDFGTGYSSLAYLHRLPVDTLKIDRSFVQELGAGGDGPTGNGVAVIRAIMSLAGTLGVRTVAEGVETELQYRFLRRLGCESMQGYLFSPAVPADDVPRIVERLSRPRTAVGAGLKRPA